MDTIYRGDVTTARGRLLAGLHAGPGQAIRLGHNPRGQLVGKAGSANIDAAGSQLLQPAFRGGGLLLQLFQLQFQRRRHGLEADFH